MQFHAAGAQKLELGFQAVAVKLPPTCRRAVMRCCVCEARNLASLWVAVAPGMGPASESLRSTDESFYVYCIAYGIQAQMSSARVYLEPHEWPGIMYPSLDLLCVASRADGARAEGLTRHPPDCSIALSGILTAVAALVPA